VKELQGDEQENKMLWKLIEELASRALAASNYFEYGANQVMIDKLLEMREIILQICCKETKWNDGMIRSAQNLLKTVRPDARAISKIRVAIKYRNLKSDSEHEEEMSVESDQPLAEGAIYKLFTPRTGQKFILALQDDSNLVGEIKLDE
jgi:hypothetical protein